MKKVKILIGVLFLTVSIGGGIGVAFADSDINGLLTSWFKQKGEESISSMEQAILSEKETQKQRLKDELQLEIQASQKKLSDFTKEETSIRVQEIQDYAEKLIANLKIDTFADEQQIKAELDAIVEKAKSDMDKIGSNPVNESGEKDNSDSSDNPVDGKSDQPVPEGPPELSAINTKPGNQQPDTINPNQEIQPF
ncbi:hypothetical protein [Bacillus sp. FJAT-49736]|uniref:hypothetical protein n=1 Tax=Bacillus sp. FJAT-49736 TaxID=2833582 RepID=UPI001BC8E50B|nr:hypothetical protein [Bacillus sp. FJAT-49736]MBS4174334.1 hypothetical protein [Bacillus sp. FJAT-49736]